MFAYIHLHAFASHLYGNARPCKDNIQHYSSVPRFLLPHLFGFFLGEELDSEWFETMALVPRQKAAKLIISNTGSFSRLYYIQIIAKSRT